MNVNDQIPCEVTITVCVEKEENGDGYFSYAPGLKGLYADGSTEEEAMKAAIDLIPIYLESLQLCNEPIPESEHVIVNVPGKPRMEHVKLECSPKESGIKSRILQPASL